MTESPSDREFDAERLASALSAVRDALPATAPDLTGVTPAKRRQLCRLMESISARLAEGIRWCDPIAIPESFFDPADPHHAAELLAQKLENSPRAELNGLPAFYGSGVYALYYKGAHSAYAALIGTEIPIYVGKVEPENARAVNPKDQGPKLHARLVRDHARSIRAAEDYANSSGEVELIQLDDFECRFMVLPSAYAAAVERNLLNRYEPVWATAVCDGFGKHGDRAETRSNARSEWDTLHPGRPWATGPENTPNPKTRDQICSAIASHLQRVRDRLGV